MFHHFADDYKMLNIVHEVYMHKHHLNLFKNRNERDIPLLLLSPDDKKNIVATEIALSKKKPNNFELMIDLCKDFNDVCTSKLLVKNITEMLADGQRKIIQFFDNTSFSPPLMQNAFTCEWPVDFDHYTFATKTSIISKENLEYILSDNTAIATK